MYDSNRIIFLIICAIKLVARRAAGRRETLQIDTLLFRIAVSYKFDFSPSSTSCCSCLRCRFFVGYGVFVPLSRRRNIILNGCIAAVVGELKWDRDTPHRSKDRNEFLLCTTWTDIERRLRATHHNQLNGHKKIGSLRVFFSRPTWSIHVITNLLKSQSYKNRSAAEIVNLRRDQRTTADLAIRDDGMDKWAREAWKLRMDRSKNQCRSSENWLHPNRKCYVLISRLL